MLLSCLIWAHAVWSAKRSIHLGANAWERDGKVRERTAAHRQTYRGERGQRVRAVLQNVAARLQQEGRDQQRQRRDACAMHSSRSCHGMQE